MLLPYSFGFEHALGASLGRWPPPFATGRGRPIT